jgi:xylitol oxidase
VAIHFTLNQFVKEVNDFLPKVEEKLSPFNFKPHWGKLFTLAPKVLQSRYERLNDFKNLVNQYDPKGKFRNDFVNKNIFS